MNAWANFFICMATAAATLTGLIFVGVSISLGRILAIPKMPARAVIALILLINVLFISSLCLVPQNIQFVGYEILAFGATTWIATLCLDIGVFKKTEPQFKRLTVQNMVFTQLATLPYLTAGVMLIFCGPVGLYWLIAGIFASVVKAMVDAWVLLIEIHR